MKRTICFFVFVLCVSPLSSLLAQGNSTFGISAGYLNPKDAKHGMLFGLNFGKAFDEAVDIGLGLDFFHTSYTEEATVAKTVDNGMTIEKTITSVEYSRTILPLSLNVNVKIPAGRYFGYYVRGGLNYEFLFSKEKNYKLQITENRNFSGLGWQAAAGIYYLIGSRSTLIANVLYNNCTVKHDLESIAGLPVAEKVNLSGLGFRFGVMVDIL
jgi:hypothetical protein